MAAETERQEKIRKAILKLRDKNGRVTARAVVNAAKNPLHPLHDEFEWSDPAAADLHRLERARQLIRFVTIEVVHHSEKHRVVCYVRDETLPREQSGYISLTSKELDRQHATQTIVAELKRCEGAIRRARGIASVLDDRFKGLSDQFEAMLERVISMRTRLDEAAE